MQRDNDIYIGNITSHPDTVPVPVEISPVRHASGVESVFLSKKMVFIVPVHHTEQRMIIE
jgi:hypothetical protein